MSSKALNDLATLLAPNPTFANDVRARELLKELGKTVLKAVNAPTEIGIGPIKYDVLNKLNEEVNDLAPGQAEKILSEVKHLLDTWP